ncbi:MAG: hypothetical protein B7Y43_15665 [Sphingomonas sp. 28-62-20]|uniref:hypothetical protein n=1 Tax=unclassified Sphingomonas TaxID=196159 RepID=UPI000BD50775|nr:hypothetical protein [Sphingomonas sp.]OYY76333.1 MAG: hypothetical protein B7Y43_15665 [Sphingomonas sp. 28-62-20]
MTAAYRLRGLGWFLSGVIVVLGFYLVSLQVAAERKRVADTNRKIFLAERDIRALETEFDTRANLAQLERWNGDVFALTAPGSDQFVPDEATLASIDLQAPLGQTGHGQVASYIVPAAPRAVEAIAPAPEPATAPIAPVAHPSRTILASVATVQPHLGGQRGATIAMLDRKLLSDSTIGDLVSSARAEAIGAR